MRSFGRERQVRNRVTNDRPGLSRKDGRAGIKKVGSSKTSTRQAMSSGRMCSGSNMHNRRIQVERDLRSVGRLRACRTNYLISRNTSGR